jgi:hypothetical protein
VAEYGGDQLQTFRDKRLPKEAIHRNSDGGLPTPGVSAQARECQAQLDAAVEGLAAASKLLAGSVSLNSAEVIEECYAGVRRAEATVAGALAAWRDFLSGQNQKSPAPGC